MIILIKLPNNPINKNQLKLPNDHKKLLGEQCPFVSEVHTRNGNEDLNSHYC